MQQSQPDRKEKEDQEKDNPALSKVIEKNIRPIIYPRAKDTRVTNAGRHTRQAGYRRS